MFPCLRRKSNRKWWIRPGKDWQRKMCILRYVYGQLSFWSDQWQVSDLSACTFLKRRQWNHRRNCSCVCWSVWQHGAKRCPRSPRNSGIFRSLWGSSRCRYWSRLRSQTLCRKSSNRRTSVSSDFLLPFLVHACEKIFSDYDRQYFSGADTDGCDCEKYQTGTSECQSCIYRSVCCEKTGSQPSFGAKWCRFCYHFWGTGRYVRCKGNWYGWERKCPFHARCHCCRTWLCRSRRCCRCDRGMSEGLLPGCHTKNYPCWRTCRM